MLKVKDTFPAEDEIDVILEDGTCLFKMDWNGEVYTTGTVWDDEQNIYKNDGYEYQPVYSEPNEADQCELLGVERL